jgi:hypothetical protein
MKRTPLRRTPMKRKPYTFKRTRLKAASDKRKAINRAAKKTRQAFTSAIDNCDLCERPGLLLIAHEIARGNRRLQFTEPAVQLALCDGCHNVVHRETGLWTKTRQLALLKLRRPEMFNLERYNRLAITRVCEDELEMFEGRVFTWNV